MSPEIWVIIVIIAVGGAAVALGWARDQARSTASLKRLTEAPKGHIPGFDGSDARYLTEADVLPAEPSAELTPAEQSLLDARPTGRVVPGRTPASFLGGRGLAILERPAVLVTGGEVSSTHALLTALGAAKRRGRPLVWVAEAFDDRALDTLRANAATGRLPCLPVRLAGSGRLADAAEASGGRVIEASDLAADYLPEDAWGACAGWVSDGERSWLIPDAAPGSPDTPGSPTQPAPGTA